MTQLKQKFSKIKEEGKEFQMEIKTRVMGYIGAGLGVVVSLAWNEAIKDLIDTFFPLEKGSLIAKFTYATIMTIILAIITVYFLKKIEPVKEKEASKK